MSSVIYGGKLNLKMNADNLSSTYSGYFSTAMNAWNTSGAHVKMTSEPFVTSLVDLRSYTSSQWDANGWGTKTFAWTQPFKKMPFLVQLTLLIIIVVQVILSSMLQFILMKAIFHQVLLKSLQM